MNVPEESDSGVVPMSHSNKDGQLSAESGEGRLLIKENARPPDTLSTERDPRVTRVGGRAEGSTGNSPAPLCRHSSAIRAVCANERMYGSVRGAISNDRPYRDLIEFGLGGSQGHPEVHHPASLMREDYQDEQDPEGRRRHGEKIDGHRLRQMIRQESSPGLRRRFAGPRQISGHGGLRHCNSQLPQFSVNPRRTPQGIRLLHAPKASRFSGPMPGESSAVPAEDRVGLNQVQTSPPTGPDSRQHNPQEPVAVVEAQAARHVVLENRKLVTKGEDLRLQGGTGPKTGGHKSEKGEEKRTHRGSHHDLTND